MISLSAAASDQQDSVQQRALHDLHNFTQWLSDNHVKGYVGEVGWPDNRDGEAQRWNRLAELWFQQADESKLWVTVWASGQWWQDYPLAIYRQRNGIVNTANSQASVLESHLDCLLRGVNVCGAEFGTPGDGSFSSHNPGAYGRAYHYDDQSTFDFLARRRIKLVRLAFRWERIQPQLGQELDPTELARLVEAVARANTAGLSVILDLHNYGEYWLFDRTKGVRQTVGSPQLPISDFADVWRRLSLVFKDSPRVFYGLMNEPHDFPEDGDLGGAFIWEQASQQALDAIRANHDSKLVLVSGYSWSSARRWRITHPQTWIADPANNFRYEAHQYFDGDGSGTYQKTYAQELREVEPATRPADVQSQPKRHLRAEWPDGSN